MKLSRKSRSNIAERLALIGQTYYETVGEPLRLIEDVLLDHGLVADMENDWHLYAEQAGKTIRCRVHAWGDEADSVNGMLVVYHYRHATGRHEITAYLS